MTIAVDWDLEHQKQTNKKAGLWKYHARLVRPGPISLRTSFYLLVPRQVQMHLVNTFCISYFDYNELTSCIENSLDPDQLASEEAS